MGLRLSDLEKLDPALLEGNPGLFLFGGIGIKVTYRRSSSFFQMDGPEQGDPPGAKGNRRGQKARDFQLDGGDFCEPRVRASEGFHCLKVLNFARSIAEETM